MLVQAPNKSTLFGSMQTDPASIRERLFTGIDGDYNVIDMDVVVDVIGQLESFQISREELEVNPHLVLSHRFQRNMKKPAISS